MEEDAGTTVDAGVAGCGLQPCGGELLGSWQATSACTRADLASTAQAVLSQPDCRDMFSSATVGASGTVRFLAGGTFDSSVMILVDWSLWVSDACAAALTSQPGLTTSSAFCAQYSQEIPRLPGTPFASGTCSYLSGGCECLAQSFYTQASAGTFGVRATEFLDGQGKRYPYCVAGDGMTFEVPDDSWGARFVVTLARQ